MLFTPGPPDLSCAEHAVALAPNSSPGSLLIASPLDLIALDTFASPANVEAGSVTVTLDSGMTEWGKHGLGRFRLSATSSYDAARRRIRDDPRSTFGARGDP